MDCYYKLRQLTLLQSAMDSHYKVWQLFLLQIATGISKCDGFITNCGRYYKVRWSLQIATLQVPFWGGFYYARQGGSVHFESFHETIKCECDVNQMKASYWAVLRCVAVYYPVQGDSNLGVCGWNSKVRPVKLMKATEQYFAVVLFIMLCKGVFFLFQAFR